MDQAVEATVDARKSLNENYNAERRGVVVGWLLEVAAEWQLDGAAPFLAVRLLDSAMARMPTLPVSMLQLAGICCLRLAMRALQGQAKAVAGAGPAAAAAGVGELGDGAGRVRCGNAPSPERPPECNRNCGRCGQCTASAATRAGPNPAAATAAGEAQNAVGAAPLVATAEAAVGAAEALVDDTLAAQRFADVCDNIYSAERIESMTLLIETCLGLTFLLQLSLLCPVCCAAPPAAVAAAALAAALRAVGLADGWPARLAARGLP
ncbi:hypothetical protein GPECTOR_364g141 [Gonium pectorale]|uniref:Cyclin N-terminal domain-containing protein n=1 Tax=Gonium pectorale TaxID=33097 RepID=A0A150FX49_GONPE|nr:hypothetical protein GPECTOR_364g141 [Gonium pectorale]|eukprot:KXZ41610.1 hypothetical protein GPECTOR_364g141 [Gonium pectorale]